MPDFTQITVSVTVHARIDQSWNAFTSPDSITQWNFASDDWCCPKATNDLRAGGEFNYRMESRDGKYGFDFQGTYTKVMPDRLIEYALEDGRSVSIHFRELGGKTEVMETFDAETENPLELQRSGWQAILDNFKKHAESMAGNI